MEEKAYLGIDVGGKGYLSLQYKGKWTFLSIIDSDWYEVDKFIKEQKNIYNDNLVCVIEDVHAIYGSSAKATFNFALNKGMLLGILTANCVSYHLVPPKTWQAEMWDNKDIVFSVKKYTDKKGNEKSRKKTNTKATSFNAAKRIFPQIDFRRNSRCKNLDDNKADATLMSEYGRRKNL